ncbi:hypothetical protein ACRYJE_00005, partial [Limosilactobacillus fermentum]|uniref:hypothetical protein n=1 Tax=Limosilactobacillus fermentum TaxID=1613 RepID=UPI003F9DD574
PGTDEEDHQDPKGGEAMQIKIKGTPDEIKKLLAIGQDNQQLDVKKLDKHMTNDLAIKEIMEEPISPYHFRSLDSTR